MERYRLRSGAGSGVPSYGTSFVWTWMGRVYTGFAMSAILQQRCDGHTASGLPYERALASRTLTQWAVHVLIGRGHIAHSARRAKDQDALLGTCSGLRRRFAYQDTWARAIGVCNTARMRADVELHCHFAGRRACLASGI